VRRREQPDPIARERFARVWPAVDQTGFDPSKGDSSPPGSLSDTEPDHGDPAGVTALSLAAPARSAGGSAALAAFSPGRRAVKALAVIAVIVVIIAALLAWRSEPRAEVISGSGNATAAFGPTSASGPATATGPSSAASHDAGAAAPTSIAPSPAMIVVAVTGRVRHPGLVALPAGARVADAITAAGGALPNTDLAFVNLARKVADGELIVIGVQPSPGEQTDPTGSIDTPAAGAAATGPVDINTAGLAQLETLPGIGPSLAQRILDYRTQHGSFRSVDDLQSVSGIGPSKYAAIKELVTT
jgi:competence protein ComEA